MIPTTLGNIVGGGLFVGAAYWYLYLTGEGDVSVDFNIGAFQSAMEAGGPMRRTKSKMDRGEANDTVMGLEPGHLPHSGGHLMSSLGKELSDTSPYAQSHAERTKSASDSSNEKV